MNYQVTAFFPGRWCPPHEGHIRDFVEALSKYDRIIIGMGSCFEVGRPRFPLLAFFREKMIRWSLVDRGIDLDRVSFVYLQDFNLWDEWWKHITSIPGIESVDYLVTGNEVEILAEIKKRNLKLPFELVDSEKEFNVDFPYHATDLRKAIADGNYEAFKKIAASGTLALMGNVGGFGGIREALRGQAAQFVPGRQAVDMIITCKGRDGEPLVLCGYRSREKENFPGCLGLPGGAVDKYENPMNAAVRELREETGLEVVIKNSYLEPAHISINGMITELRFVGLFGTPDLSKGGNQGGSSQVFHINLDATPESFAGQLKSESDLDDVDFRPVGQVLGAGLAYQQNEMLRKALGR
jgi:nicotinamide mononucleotide adenylyltransferase/8-oxo-dGTP pyrophosphatase MutT (NUDIX family)